MMQRFDVEPLAVKPTAFDPWLDELGLFADCEGFEALIGVLIHYAPPECVRYLASQPAIVASLVARARFADWQRYEAGLLRGRGMGL